MEYVFSSSSFWSCICFVMFILKYLFFGANINHYISLISNLFIADIEIQLIFVIPYILQHRYSQLLVSFRNSLMAAEKKIFFFSGLSNIP